MTSSADAARQANRDFWSKLGLAVMIGAAFFCVMPVGRMIRAQNDFAHWYIGGTLFGSPEIYSEKVNQALQTKLIGGVLEHSFFIRPTFYGLLMKPLSMLPYHTAYWIFQFISVVVCLGYFLRTFARQWRDLWVCAAMSIPVISNIINGQDVTLLMAFCTASVVLARKNRDFLAGLVFSLCAIKFHLFVLTPIAMLGQKRWRIFLGGAVGEVVLFLLGLTGGGFEVFMSLVRILSKSENHPYPEMMPNLRGMVISLTGAPNTPLVLFLSLAVVAAVIFLSIRAENYEKAFAYTLMGGLLVNLHANVQDPMLLLLAAAVLIDGKKSPGFRATFFALLFPAVYILLMWQPPYSATFAILMLMLFGFAVRDEWRRIVASRFTSSPTDGLLQLHDVLTVDQLVGQHSEDRQQTPRYATPPNSGDED